MNLTIALVWLAVLRLIGPTGDEDSMTVQYVDPQTFQPFTHEQCEAFVAQSIAADPPPEGSHYVGQCVNEEPQPYPGHET